MGFFSGIFRGIKKAVKGVTKVVKKVVKSIAKVGKKIWKGVKGIAKKISKLGPLASIAIGFIPGFQGLWASSGIWGAMAKGALTGFITSGGKVKGALMGAVGGGIGYGLNAGMNAYKQGVSTLGENATISEQITAGLKSVGNSTIEGASNLYKSAANLGSPGNLNYLRDDPITGELTSIYGDSKASVFARMDGESVLHGANKNYISSLDTNAKSFMEKNPDLFKTHTPKQINQIFENQSGVTQLDKLTNYNEYVTSEKLLASQSQNITRTDQFGVSEPFLQKGYTYDPYSADSPITPSSAEYQSGLDARGLDARGVIAKTLDQPLKPNIMDVNYEGGLEYTEMGMDETSFSKSQRTVAPRTSKSNAVDKAVSSLLAGSETTPAGLPFGAEDTGDNYDVAGGLKPTDGTAGVAFNFANNGYGGMSDPLTVALNANRNLQAILKQYAS